MKLQQTLRIHDVIIALMSVAFYKTIHHWGIGIIKTLLLSLLCSILAKGTLGNHSSLSLCQLLNLLKETSQWGGYFVAQDLLKHINCAKKCKLDR